jgi:hypothetical protein
MLKNTNAREGIWKPTGITGDPETFVFVLITVTWIINVQVR